MIVLPGFIECNLTTTRKKNITNLVSLLLDSSSSLIYINKPGSVSAQPEMMVKPYTQILTAPSSSLSLFRGDCIWEKIQPSLDTLSLQGCTPRRLPLVFFLQTLPIQRSRDETTSMPVQNLVCSTKLGHHQSKEPYPEKQRSRRKVLTYIVDQKLNFV